MAARKTIKVITKRKKYLEVDIPLTRTKVALVGNSIEELKDKTITLDLTRQLRGKSVEATVKVKIENEKAVAYPKKIKLMPFFIRRMIRKRISYVEDAFIAPSQESMLIIKPFLITRKRVSRVVRKTLRNKARNWIEDYVAERTDKEIFNEILSNRMQKPLSLVLKKTYPLSLCEIRVLEIKRELKPEEIPKIEKKKKIETQYKETEEVIDQLQEIEDEKIKKAEEKIKETQEKAVTKKKIEKEIEEGEEEKPVKKKIDKEMKKTKKALAKKK